MNYSFVVLVFLLFLLGCNSDPGPAGPERTGPFGEIVGKASLYSDNGIGLQDNSGITVSLEGNSYSTLTKSDGSWKLTEIPAGVYTLVFSKTGFFTIKDYEVHVVGNDTVNRGSYNFIGQIPNVTFKHISITGPDSNNYFNINGNISLADSLLRSAYIIYNKEPISVSSTIISLMTVYHIIQPNSTSFSWRLDYIDSFKKEYNLSPGSKIYLRVLLRPRAGRAISYNPFNGNVEIYNGQNALSNLDSLIVP